LAAALELHIAGIIREGLYIDVDAADYRPQPPAQEEALYRIVQEALHNVVKHAHARRVEITLGAVDGSIHLTVKDDGRGFALACPQDRHRVPFADQLCGRLRVKDTTRVSGIRGRPHVVLRPPYGRRQEAQCGLPCLSGHRTGSRINNQQLDNGLLCIGEFF
jgi:hypothetical protein